RNLIVFTAIALLTLMIAVVNFMNLATARSLDRAREVGVRRVVGGQRSQVATQFLFETLLLTLIALVVAVGLAVLAMPSFNAVAGTNLHIADALSLRVLLAAFGGTALVGLLAGS